MIPSPILPEHHFKRPLLPPARNAPSGPLVPLLFPGVKGEAISRSALGARAGLSAAIPKVGGGICHTTMQQRDVQDEGLKWQY